MDNRLLQLSTAIGALLSVLPCVCRAADVPLPDAPARAVLYVQAPYMLTLEAGVNVLNVDLANVSHHVFDGELRIDLPEGLRSVGQARLPLRILPGRQRFLFLKVVPDQLPRLSGSHLVVRLVDRQGREVASGKVLLQASKSQPIGSPPDPVGQHPNPSGDSVRLAVPVDVHADSVLVLQAGINGLDLRLANLGDHAFAGNLRIDLPTGLHSINGTNLSLNIPPGKKRFLSLKLTARQLSRLKNAQMAVRLTDGNDREIHRLRVRIQVPEKRSVVLQDHSGVQYLRQVGDFVRVKLRVANNGTTDERLRLVFSSPDRGGDRNFKETTLLLPSGGDSLLRFSFMVEKHMLALPQYTVRVVGLYTDRAIFGQVTMSFSNIASERDFRRMFRANNQAAVYSNNYIDFEMEDVLEEHRRLSLSAQGEYRLRGGKIRYHAQLGGQNGLRHPPSIGNTYVEYEKDNMRVGLGNVQESLERGFYGRGFKVAFRDTARSRVFSGGIAEKSSGLFGPSNGRILGLSAFTRLVQGEGDRRHRDIQLHYDKNRLDSTESLLWSNSFDVLPLPPSDGIRLRALAGVGLQNFRTIGPDPSYARSSAALGIKWSGKHDRWSYSGEGFFSTPHYPGNRQGVLQFGQRLARNARKSSYEMGYSFFRYAPRYFRNGRVSSGSTYSKVDLSVYVPISPSVGINLNPSYHHEKGSHGLHKDDMDLAVRSWLLAARGNLRTPNHRHSLHTLVETGWMSVDRPAIGSFVLRSSASYNYKRLGFSAAYQKGAFQVFEILTARLSGARLGNRTSFGLSYDGSLFDRMLLWQVNAHANISPRREHGYTAHAGTTYQLRQGTVLTGTFQYRYDKGARAFGSTRTNLHIGLRQNLMEQDLRRPAEKAGNLNVFCFYDNNSNDRFDQGDEIAAGYAFMVRDVLFVTDKKGTASFRKMPYGSYMLFFPMSGGYRGVSRAVLMGRGGVDLAVPLQKVGTARGALSIDHDPNFSLKADMRTEGYKIVARDGNGRTFETYSREDGSFEMNLPQGRYSFALAADTFPENIFMEENGHAAEVAAGKTVEIGPFVLRVKRKKVEVKRF